MKIRAIGVLLAFVSTAFAQVEEISWPQELVADNGAVVLVYQPQIEEFSTNSLEGRAAVSVKSASSGGAPVFGAIWFKAKIDTDRDTRTAVLRDVEVSDVRFADAEDAQKQRLADFIGERISGSRFTISVDALLEDLEGSVDPSTAPELNSDPPIIMLSTKPAILVSIDGDPVFRDIEGSRYEHVINTPFLIARGGMDLYLYIGSNAWYQAQAIEGPWSPAGSVPEDVAKLVEPADDDASLTDIDIIIATGPTELIVSAGPPSWSPVEGMDLLYMDNTDSDVFMELSTQRYYVLLSGRWYKGEGIEGDLNWTHVPNDALPVPFTDIPEDSVNAAVLSQVAGTPQARAAVLDNTIPQTAAVKRDDSSFSVEYDGGAPEFAPIEEIPVEYAQNTSAAVFRYGNLYYACDEGVWYVANSATGPWTVATEVPDAIYDIPATNPHYNVTYVKVYDVTPQVVYVGYTPGYYGSYYYHGSIVYGTGWYYRPWYGPYYYPRYPTWGFRVTYNPWYGWGFGVTWTNGPFRFTFAPGGAWWGVGGYRPYPRPMPYGAGFHKTNINVNINNNININRGNQLQNRPNLYNQPQNQDRLASRPAVPTDRTARPANGVQNNVLTDRSGNIYQRDAGGDWQQREQGQWKSPQNLDRASPSTRPAPSQPTPSTRDFNRPAPSQPAVRPQLERDFSARQQGVSRTQSFQQQAGGRRRR